MSAGGRLPGAPEPTRFWPGADGITLAGDECGNPSGPLVILQHGGGQTRHAWKNVGAKLGSAGFRVIAFDARGHGDSDWARDGRYGQDAMINDLVCLLRELGNPRAALVGASMGGGTSLVAIGEDRVDATALVMVDIAPRVERDGVARIRAFMHRKPEGFVDLEEAADAIAGYQPHRARPRNLAGLAKNLRLGEDGRYRWHWDPLFLAREIDVRKRQQRFEACAARLRLPVLLVRGGLSDVLTEAGAREFLALCPHSEYVSVGSAGHMIAGDRNDAFGEAVIDFLARAVPVGSEPVYPPHAPRPHREGPEGDLTDIP
ncbi:MAG TPA: alpha/beta hydrolase [Casimicrobiaceae bacterium]|nr:alpha/beta hydrolase [Casimicrobiaceae bacterium]